MKTPTQGWGLVDPNGLECALLDWSKGAELVKEPSPIKEDLATLLGMLLNQGPEGISM